MEQVTRPRRDRHSCTEAAREGAERTRGPGWSPHTGGWRSGLRAEAGHEGTQQQQRAGLRLGGQTTGPGPASAPRELLTMRGGGAAARGLCKAPQGVSTGLCLPQVPGLFANLPRRQDTPPPAPQRGLCRLPRQGAGAEGLLEGHTPTKVRPPEADSPQGIFKPPQPASPRPPPCFPPLPPPPPPARLGCRPAWAGPSSHLLTESQAEGPRSCPGVRGGLVRDRKGDQTTEPAGCAERPGAAREGSRTDLACSRARCCSCCRPRPGLARGGPGSAGSKES